MQASKLPKPWHCFEDATMPTKLSAKSEEKLSRRGEKPMHVAFFQRRSHLDIASYPSEWSLAISHNRAVIRSFPIFVTDTYYLKFDGRYFASIINLLWHLYDRGLVDKNIKSAVNFRYNNSQCYVFISTRNKHASCHMQSNEDYRRAVREKGAVLADDTMSGESSHSEPQNIEVRDPVVTPPDLNVPLERRPDVHFELDASLELLAAPIRRESERERQEYESEKRRLSEERERLVEQQLRLSEQLKVLDTDHAAKRQRTKESLQRASATIMEKWALLASTLE
jgi:hypothetical protein